MQKCLELRRRLHVVTLLGAFVLVSSGCQTWHASSAIPGWAAKQGEQQVLRQAQHDPFPSPSDVGMKAN